MKLSLAFAFMALSSAAVAAPGSYAPVTVSLTVKFNNNSVGRPVKNGNTEFTYSTGKYTVSNTTILAEATARGLLDTTDYRGWAIVAAYDQDAEFIGFYAFNKTLNQAVKLSQIIAPDSEQGARIDSGKVQRTPADQIASGSLRYTEAGPLYLELDEVFFSGMVSLGGNESLKTVATGGRQWVTGPQSGPVLGFTEDGETFSGKISAKPGVQVADLTPVFVDPVE